MQPGHDEILQLHRELDIACREQGAQNFISGWQTSHPFTAEPTAHLEPALTLRLVCPTKSLAVHGVRFAYVLLPADWREAMRYACSNVTGATGGVGAGYACRIMRVMASSTANAALLDYIAARHRSLKHRRILLEEAVRPCASYYTFAKVDAKVLKDALAMDQRYFGVWGYDGFVRVNLLHPGW